MHHHNHQNPVARPDASMASEHPKRDTRKYGHPTDYHAAGTSTSTQRQTAQRSTSSKRRRRDRIEAQDL